jgi:hypothetical protein
MARSAMMRPLGVAPVTIGHYEERGGHFMRWLIGSNAALIFDPRRLCEPSSIAHSAFLILSLVESSVPNRESTVVALADGILHQQWSDGNDRRLWRSLVPSKGSTTHMRSRYATATRTACEATSVVLGSPSLIYSALSVSQMPRPANGVDSATRLPTGRNAST